MVKKKSTEYVRAFRARQRASKPPKPPPKSNRERAREYRARKKALLNASCADDSSKISTVLTDAAPQELPQTSTVPTTFEESVEMYTNTGNKLSSTEFNIMDTFVPYSDFMLNEAARKEFKKKFSDNPFGYACDVCDQLWFKNDLKIVLEQNHRLLRAEFPEMVTVTDFKVCQCCFSSLKRNRIPTYSTSNGFKYPEKPRHLPDLGIESQKLISPKVPFLQIRRLRHTQGGSGMLGQIINVPIGANSMINKLPRDIKDDYCINVHINQKVIYTSNYLLGFINKANIKLWLKYLSDTPVYKFYRIKIDNSFFKQTVPNENPIPIDEISEDIRNEDCLTAQQQTLIWSEDKYLEVAPGSKNVPHSWLFDEHAEELSFPTIYLGRFRVFKEELCVTPFMIATSEVRRADRRGVTPHHLLYVAMKILRLRVRDALTAAFKHIGNNEKVTKAQIQSEEYINQSIDTNLVFLKCIPNSVYYWADKRKDLFAMIRQYGKPTLFLTLSANETGWIDLLKLLWKLKHYGRELPDEMVAKMTYIEKCTMVNEDAVTCAIYFNKLINVILNLLQLERANPFGEYQVIHYFQRIEFHNRGSPCAYILLWIGQAPFDSLHVNRGDAIAMIDKLISVSPKEASGNIKLQIHEHTSACYEKAIAKEPQQCRFEIPFMPCKKTTILIPMKSNEENFEEYRQHYEKIRANLANYEYVDMETFYDDNNITSDKHYVNILRAGITVPKVFLKRLPSEKWYNAFNPFIFNVLQSNMDVQYILDEDCCAAYIAEYVGKTNRGMSNLQHRILQVMNDHPEFDIIEITRKMGVDILNTTEITTQEAAWFLLRQPVAKTSAVIAFIPTVWPIERQRIRNIRQEMGKLGLEDESIDIWKENWFDNYQQRPDALEECTLAQFVANYNISGDMYTRRRESRIIRYRNYDMTTDLNEYKREMVTLHIPFRDEEFEILEELKFVKIYDDNEQLILQRRKEFELNLDIQKTIESCKKLCQECEGMRDNGTLEAVVCKQEPDEQELELDLDVQKAIETYNELYQENLSDDVPMDVVEYKQEPDL